AGGPCGVGRVVAERAGSGCFCWKVQVDVAAHSPRVAVLQEELVADLGGISPQAARSPLYSTVRGQRVGGEELDAGYWAANLREPVLFWETLEALVGEEHRIFVEISPHPVLAPAIADGLRVLDREGM